MSEKDPKSPATTSFAYDRMAGRWHKMSSLLGGTETMRMAGSLYLPQHEEESHNAYAERRDSAVLLNMTSLTLDSWVGRPFSDKVRIGDDMPQELTDLTEDLDLQGNNIDVFAREWFRAGVGKGLCHILVEFPRIEDPDGTRTREDDVREGVRPYWVKIEPEDLIFARASLINGVETLTHVRISEVEVVQEGFAEVVLSRIRVMDLVDEGVLVRLFELNPDTAGSDDEEWLLVDEFVMDIARIPLVTFYANREGFMLSKPPLQDLADLNIRHWQSMSDQISVLTVTRFPMLAMSGATDEDAVLRVGPNEWLATPDPQSKIYYVEHSGKAIAAGKAELDDLVRQMSQYGAEFLKKRTSRETATARALDSAESTSPLQDMVIRFIDAMEQAFVFTAMWLGTDTQSVGSIDVASDFGPEESDQDDLMMLKEARAMRDISRKAFIAELQRRGILAEDFDPEADERALESEGLGMDPGLDDPEPDPEPDNE